MKPKPRVTLKNFTVPVVISHAFSVIRTRNALARGVIDHTSHLENSPTALRQGRSLLNPLWSSHNPIYGNRNHQNASRISFLFRNNTRQNLLIAAGFSSYGYRIIARSAFVAALPAQSKGPSLRCPGKGLGPPGPDRRRCASRRATSRRTHQPPVEDRCERRVPSATGGWRHTARRRQEITRPTPKFVPPTAQFRRRSSTWHH